MILKNNAHLTYCTNIHPGESWNEVFENLQNYCLPVKKQLSPDRPFGIGLRLSQKSAASLLKDNRLDQFNKWLEYNGLYVFTLNGFPYGDFHHVEIKDKVHLPDWTTVERIAYTKDLMKILSHLLPEGMEGGVSTSPLSYKLWFDNKDAMESVKIRSCHSLMDIVLQLVEIKRTTGKILHLDLEPEPDGVLENTREVIDFFKDFLLKVGCQIIVDKLNCSNKQAEIHILEHIQICYDVCHFALAYEKPNDVIDKLQQEGIKIGKMQISAALKCEKSKKSNIAEQQGALENFDEPTYLHQSIVKYQDGSLKHFSDLNEGIVEMKNKNFKEIRTHFHVPVFVSDYQVLKSTQNDIISALQRWKKDPFCSHLEVETYTWSILPEQLQTNITDSIVRELKWTLDQIHKEV